jgi:hypothetical protein
VNEVNSAPVLAAITDKTADELTLFTYTVMANDSDLPSQALTYSLEASPVGMTINPSTGVITWTPTEAQGQNTNTVTVKVTDNGTPSLSNTKTFKVVVNEVNTAPEVETVANQTVIMGSSLNLILVARDSDLPANKLTFKLGVNCPVGAAIDSTSGRLSWKPGPEYAGTTNHFSVDIRDDGIPVMEGSIHFDVIVGQDQKFELLPAGMQNGTFRLTLKASAGLNYKLEGSQNLVDWLDILTTNSTENTIFLQDTNSTVWSNRFYRVLRLP